MTNSVLLLMPRGSTVDRVRIQYFLFWERAGFFSPFPKTLMMPQSRGWHVHNVGRWHSPCFVSMLLWYHIIDKQYLMLFFFGQPGYRDISPCVVGVVLQLMKDLMRYFFYVFPTSIWMCYCVWQVRTLCTMATAEESCRLIRQPGGSVRMFSGARMNRSVSQIAFKCDQGDAQSWYY